jgi:zinc protease
MAGLIENYFSKMSRSSGVKSFAGPLKDQPLEKIRESIVNVDREQSLILIGFSGIDIYDKDKFALEVLANILSNPSGVLFKSIRDNKGLAYAVGAFNVMGIDPGYLAVYGLTSEENIDKTRRGIFRELDSIIKNGVTEDDIEMSRNYLKAMRKVDMQANSSFIFSAALDELYGLGYDDYKNFDRNIDAVTRDDVKRVAKRILTLDRCAVLVLNGK